MPILVVDKDSKALVKKREISSSGILTNNPRNKSKHSFHGCLWNIVVHNMANMKLLSFTVNPVKRFEPF